MPGMKEITEIRLDNARQLAEQAGGTSAFAARIDREPTQASRFMGKNPSKGIGAKLARHIEERFGKPRGWLDTDHGARREPDRVSQHPAMYEPNVAPAPRMEGYVPVLSWVQAGNWQEVVTLEELGEDADQAPRPPNCSSSTFALRVRGQSMSPKYEPGLIIYVDPEVVPFDGDDVVAMLTEHGGAEATFKQLVEEPGGQRLLKARNPAWPDPWIPINGNCHVIGVIIGSLWLRTPRGS